MLPIGNSPLIRFIPTIEISDEVFRCIKGWQKIEYPLQKASDSPIPTDDKLREWVILKTSTSSVFLKINEIKKILVNPVYSKANLCLDLNKVSNCLQTRFFDPDLDFLEEYLPKSLKPRWLELSEKIKQTFHKMPIYSNNIERQDVVFHCRRAVSLAKLPTEIDTTGRVYAIAKLETHSSPFTIGLVKKLYFAVDLHTLKPAAWAKIPLQNHSEMTPQRIRKDVTNEIEILQSFHTPEFVKIYHYCIYVGKNNEEKISIMMEFCESNLELFLQDKSNRNSPNNQQELWNIFEDICSALAQMEARKIHHRDLKTANVFLVKTENGFRAKLGDFGFAISVTEESENPRFCGSLEYIAPEFQKAHLEIQSAIEIFNKSDKKIRGGNTKKEIAEIYLDRACKLINESENSIYASLSDEVQKTIATGERLNKEATEEIRIGKIERANALITINQNSRKAASTKCDMWCLGLILAQMRLGGHPSAILFGENTDLWTQSKFMNNLGSLTQDSINRAFTSRKEHCELEDLNRRLLSIDQNVRVSALDCLNEIREMRRRNVLFV